jgi:hypothetical protein
MARTNPDGLLKNVSGKIGDQIVVKQYKDKIVISKYPDMSKVKPSKLQKNNRSLFKEAVAYAMDINRNPQKRKIYLQKVSHGESVYRFALKEYLTNQAK